MQINSIPQSASVAGKRLPSSPHLTFHPFNLVLNRMEMPTKDCEKIITTTPATNKTRFLVSLLLRLLRMFLQLSLLLLLLLLSLTMLSKTRQEPHYFGYNFLPFEQDIRNNELKSSEGCAFYEWDTFVLFVGRKAQDSSRQRRRTVIYTNCYNCYHSTNYIQHKNSQC